MAKKSMTSATIRVKDVRGAFMNLAKPKAFEEGGALRYEATLLLDPTNPAHKGYITEIKTAIKELALKMWGGLPDEIKSGEKICLQNNVRADGTQKKKYDGYADMYFVPTANPTRPLICAGNGKEIGADHPEFPYSGSYCNFSISLWTQDNKYGKRVNANLIAVQFSKEGARFGGAAAPNAEEEFEALGDSPASAGAAAQAAADDDIAF